MGCRKRCFFFITCCGILITFSIFFTFHSRRFTLNDKEKMFSSNKIVHPKGGSFDYTADDNKRELQSNDDTGAFPGRGSINGYINPGGRSSVQILGKERKLAAQPGDDSMLSEQMGANDSEKNEVKPIQDPSTKVKTTAPELSFWKDGDSFGQTYHQEIAKSLPPPTENIELPPTVFKNEDTPLPMDTDNVKVNMQGLPYTKPKHPNLRNQEWQVVNSSKEAYLLSAYFDDRPSLDAPMIRIIGIFEPNISAPHCLHWYQIKNQSNPDVVMGELIQIGPNINPVTTTKYGQFILSCALAPGKTPPLFVSVVTPDSNYATTLLLVQWPVKSAEQIEFGQCMSVVYGDHDPFRLVEWLELQKLVGVGEVTLYNNSLNAISSMIVNHYATVDRYVVVKQLPSVLNDDGELTILMNMSPAINDCMYRNMYKYKWVISSDLDEVIIPTTFANYSSMVEALVTRHSPDNEVMSLMFKNVYYFDDLGPVSRNPWYLWTTRYLRHISPSPYGYAVKSFSNPQACVGLQNHLCWKRVPSYQNSTTWNIDVGLNYGKNQHYKRCHFDTYLERNGVCRKVMRRVKADSTVLRFQDKLKENVVEKLLELDLIEKVK